MTTAGSRREARERALALLYEAEAKSDSPAAVIAQLPIEPDPYAARLVRGVEEYGDEIDALLSRYSKGWRLERMPAVDRAVLRVAVYELLAEPGVPTAAVVSEAVELASEYSTDESGRFVNGLLARIATETRGGEAPPPHLPPERPPTETIDLGVDPEFELPVAPGSSHPPAATASEAPRRPTGPPRAELAHTDPVLAEPSLAEHEPGADPVVAEHAPAGVEREPGTDPVVTEGEPEPDSVRAVPQPSSGSSRPLLPLGLPQPPLGDGVIRLRPWQPADAPALVAAWADPAVGRWSAPPARRSLVDARRWIAGTPGLRARGLALDLVISSIGARPVVLGEVALSAFDDDGGADIGYWIGPEHRGKGHATRAVRLLTAWALNQHGLRQVRATVDPRNRASTAVLRRAGFRAAGPDRWVCP